MINQISYFSVSPTFCMFYLKKGKIHKYGLFHKGEVGRHKRGSRELLSSQLGRALTNSSPKFNH